MTYRAILHGLRVTEVPITFRDRRAGTSKMSGKIAFEAMTAVVKLRSRAEAEARELNRSS
jgi:dolichol-phosphate mannosyltransferase